MQTCSAQSQASCSSGVGPCTNRPLSTDGCSGWIVCPLDSAVGRRMQGRCSQRGVTVRELGGSVNSQIFGKGTPGWAPVCVFTSPPEILNVESLWSTSSWFREVCSLSERSFHRSSFLLPLARLRTLGCAVGMTAASSGHRRVAVHSGASQGSSLVLLCTRLHWALRTTLSPPGAQTPPGETGWGHLQNIVCTFSNCYQ